MQAGTHGDTVAVHHLGNVMGVGTLDGEGEDGPLPNRSPDLGQPVPALQSLADPVHQRILVGPHRIGVELLHPADRRTEADDLKDRRRARLEPVRQARIGDRILGHRRDHLAAALVWRQCLQCQALAVQAADAGRAEQLVPGEDIEVGVQRLDIRAAVHRPLTAVDQKQRPGRMSEVGDCADIVHCAQNIRHMGHGDQFRPRADQRGQPVQVQRPVVQHRGPFQHDPQPVAQHRPGHDVGVVLHLRRDDLIARLQALCQARRDQIEGFGPALGPDDLVGAFGVQEAGDGFPRLFESLGRLIGQGVQATVNVGIGAFHRRGQGIDHRARLLRRGGRVQIDQRLAVHRPRQDRELRPGGIGVEAGQSRAVSHDLTTSLAPSCAMRSTTSNRKACVRSARASSAGIPRCCM